MVLESPDIFEPKLENVAIFHERVRFFIDVVKAYDVHSLLVMIEAIQIIDLFHGIEAPLDQFALLNFEVHWLELVFKDGNLVINDWLTFVFFEASFLRFLFDNFNFGGHSIFVGLRETLNGVEES